MKRILLALVILLSGTWAYGAIAFTSFQSCTQSSTSTLTCAASMTLSTNDAVVLNIGYTGTNANLATTNTVVDSCANTWTHQTGASGSQSTVFSNDAWTSIITSGGTCTITVTRNSGTYRFGWTAANYSGVGSIGATGFASHTNSTSATVSLTTQDNNNFVVGVFGVSAGGETCSATSGTLRGQFSISGPGTGCLTDNTAASPSSVTNAISLTSTGAGTNGAIELRAGGSTGRQAVDSDSGLLVGFNEGSNASYTLPANPSTIFTHNKSSWNVTVWAAGAAAYKIVVQSPSTLTICGTTASSVFISRGQFLRIWTDGTNYYSSNCPHSLSNTVSLTADSASITATTAGTATTVFTFPALVPNTNYSFHCSGTTVQSTAGAGIGIAITMGTNAAQFEAHATVATSATATAYASSGQLNTTTPSAIYTGSTGTVTTQLPWEVDGSIEAGANAPTVTIGFFSANASDAVVVKRESYCTLMP